MRFWICLLVACAAVSSARAAPPLEAYGRLPAIDAVSISASGEMIALTYWQDGEHRLLVRSALGPAVLEAPIQFPRMRGLQWAGDDHVVLFGLNTIRNPYDGLGRSSLAAAVDVPVRGGPPYTIFGNSRILLTAIGGWFGDSVKNGKTYAYVGGFPLNQQHQSGPDGRGYLRPNLYRVDLATGLPSLVDSVVIGAKTWVVQPDGVVLAHSERSEDGLTWTLHAGEDNGQPLLTLKGVAAATLAGPGRAPGTVVVVDRSVEDRAVAREVSLDGSHAEDLPTAFAEGRLLFDQETGLLIGVSSDEGARVTLLDPAMQKRFDALRRAFPTSRVKLVDFGRKMERIVVLTEGPEDPGSYWLADAPRKAVDRIGRLRPDIGATDIGSTRMVAYKAGDGLAMEGVLTLPPGREAKNLPLLVLPHGGLQGAADTVSFDWMAQAFASRGYAVFQPNYRGSSGYGPAFRAAGLGELGRKIQTDISDGVKALASQGIVDPKRVCIAGLDYGGYAALAGVTLQQGLYRCAAAVGAYSDLVIEVRSLREQRGYDERVVAFMGQVLGSLRDADLEAISPARQAARADAPVLLIYGSDDTEAGGDQSRTMERALRKAGKPVEFVIVAGADHELSAAAHRQEVLTRLVAFVETNNPAQ